MFVIALRNRIFKVKNNFLEKSFIFEIFQKVPFYPFLEEKKLKKYFKIFLPNI